MSARDNILARIRSQSGKAGLTTDAELAAVRAHISGHERGPVPSFAMHDPVQHFIEECARLSTTIVEVSDIAAIPLEVARYIDGASLQRRGVGSQRTVASSRW